MRRLWSRLRAWGADVARYLGARPLHMGVVLGAGVLGLASGKPVADDAFTYLWADDRFCNDCHVHDYANTAFDQSAHAGLTTCHDCHLVPIRHYPRNLVVTIFDAPTSPDDIHTPHVDDRICRACHAADGLDAHTSGPMPREVRAQVVKIDESPLHTSHLAATAPSGQGVTCLDCHGGIKASPHTFRTRTAACLDCHPAMAGGHAGQPLLECRSCHHAGFTGQ